MSAKQIIEEIDKLPKSEKEEVYSYFEEQLSLSKKKKAVEIISRLRGRGKNILHLEPQEYINAIRADDRIWFCFRWLCCFYLSDWETEERKKKGERISRRYLKTSISFLTLFMLFMFNFKIKEKYQNQSLELFWLDYNNAKNYQGGVRGGGGAGVQVEVEVVKEIAPALKS